MNSFLACGNQFLLSLEGKVKFSSLNFEKKLFLPAVPDYDKEEFSRLLMDKVLPLLTLTSRNKSVLSEVAMATVIGDFLPTLHAAHPMLKAVLALAGRMLPASPKCLSEVLEAALEAHFKDTEDATLEEAFNRQQNGQGDAWSRLIDNGLFFPIETDQVNEKSVSKK